MTKQKEDDYIEEEFGEEPEVKIGNYTERINVRFTKDEFKLVKKVAKIKDKKTSAFIRWSAINEAEDIYN